MISLLQPLPGVQLLQPQIHVDDRGDFVKTYHEGTFVRLGISFESVEEYFSTSRKGTLRGMHFQLPPHDHAKLVYCIRGRVLDVLVDLRKSSPSYGAVSSVELSGENRLQIYIPNGLAHGFLALEDDSVMVYKTTSVHAPGHDAGIRWDSIGFEWGTASPRLSDRDATFPSLAGFCSPF